MSESISANPSPNASKSKSPWTWVPSLYFAEGLPYTVVMLLAVVFYKKMGVSNTDIALYTSWLYLPWVVKPLWSPVVEVLRTKRFWIIAMQLLIGAGLGCVVLSIPSPMFFKISLGFLWLLAFSSATHDIAADGFYMLGLSEKDQAWYVGIRSTFYRLAMITGQGLLIILAGFIESRTGLPDRVVHFKMDPIEERLVVSPLSQGFEDSNAIQVKVLQEVEAHAYAPEDWGIFLKSINQFNLDRSQGVRQGVVPQLTGSPGTAEVDRGVSKSLGSVVVMELQLEKQPPEGEDRVVTVGRTAGDKGIRLVNAERVTFNDKTWNQPFLVVVQGDSRLDPGAQARFTFRSGNIKLSWMVTFSALAILFALFFFYHAWVLPHPETDRPGTASGLGPFFQEFAAVFVEFFKKKQIALAVLFILVYRLGEAQLVKIAPLFMLDTMEKGGLALTTAEYGFVYGTLGVVALTLGGIIGGMLASRHGLNHWILWMALAMNVPDLVFVFLAYLQPEQLSIVAGAVCVEQFGYGFGFTAYLLYMINVSEGRHKTSHYALCTGLMALGMMLPGMVSGWIQEMLGYRHFFIWVVIACLPGILMIRFLKIDPSFGKKS